LGIFLISKLTFLSWAFNHPQKFFWGFFIWGLFTWGLLIDAFDGGRKFFWEFFSI
jgi:hypothetical protein